MAEEDHFALFKPGVINIILFIFLIVLHFLGSYSSTFYGARSDDLKLAPFYETFRFYVDSTLSLVFYWIWLAISAPLLVTGHIIISIISYFGINTYSYLNRIVVFIIFVLYYYFLASVISYMAKSKGH
ncbi:MAG: hypothetical protein Q7S22_05515 [Candidatus Micrarchaeota archaeon]|nr:hypothetical protein [Candidatus Micrarchaeota archaeon]